MQSAARRKTVFTHQNVDHPTDSKKQTRRNKHFLAELMPQTVEKNAWILGIFIDWVRISIFQEIKTKNY